MDFKFFGLGLLFAALWASAAAAGKVALPYIEPLMLYQIRFFLAGFLLLIYVHLIKKEKLPTEWKSLSVFGLLNTTLYLSLFILALKEVSAGVASLSTSTNTLFISCLSVFILGEKLSFRHWFAVLCGFIGIALACFPLIEDGHVSFKGLFLLFLSMFSYSLGTIFFAKTKWQSSRIVINGWQVMLGGFFMLPFTLANQKTNLKFNETVIISILWLVIPVSILAVQLWLRLLKANPVKASYFLFLCPIFGFIYANLLLSEPITFYTYIGTALVLLGLYIGQKTKT